MLKVDHLYKSYQTGRTTFQAGRAMKRTNVMEVINEQRRQEPMKKSVSKAYLAAVFGVYRVLVYTVSSHQRGRNPQKYYNNLIDYGMMKFQGASVVRNMLVITLLLFGRLYAVSYLPMMLSTSSQEAGYEADYSYRFLNDADEPDKSEINDMAAKHNVTVENYREGAFLRIFGSVTERDSDDGSQLTETYYDRYTQYDVTSASEFEKMTGIYQYAVYRLSAGKTRKLLKL